MRMCSVQELKTGYVLGKSIFLDNNRLLLGAGYRITDSVKDKLIEKGYTHVYIREEGTEDVLPEDVISDQVRLESKRKLGDKVSQIRKSTQFQEMSYSKVLETLESGKLKDVEITYDMRKIVKEMLQDILSSNIKFMSSIMPKSKDTYFMDHSVNVAVLSILLGKKCKFTKPELLDLGMGAFMHDIGKVIIEELEEKKNNGDIDYYREHPTFGYLLLSNDKNISSLVLQTVNQHHEQQDGKGFPIGLTGSNKPPIKSTHQRRGSMFRFAEICAVADAYDKLLLSEEKGKILNPSDVIKRLLVDAGTKFNKHIIETLFEIVPVYPVGSFIRINNIVDPSLIGCYGVVAKINENDMKRPTVIITMNKYRKKIKPIIIDTSKLARVELKLLI